MKSKVIHISENGTQLPAPGTNQNRIDALEKQLREMTNSRDYWMNEEMKMQKRFDALRNSIKNVIELTD